MRNLVIGVVVFCASAAVGALALRTVAIESGYLLTEYNFERALRQQRVAEFAQVCDAYGEQEWAADGHVLADLQSVANIVERSRYAAEVLDRMDVGAKIKDEVAAKCSALLGKSTSTSDRGGAHG